MKGKEFQLSGKNIVLISPEPWGDNLLSKHHIAMTLAQRNNTVWFVCPTQANGRGYTSSIAANLFLIMHKPGRGINRLPRGLARWVARYEVGRILSIIGQKVDIVWSFDAYHLRFMRLFNPRLTIYHAVDNHYTALEKHILREADIVLTNCNVTMSRLIHNNKHTIGHGVAPHFLQSPRPVDVPGVFERKVGYVGNLNNRLFDFEMFYNLAKNHPRVGFYLIGPRGSSNLSASNVSVFDWSEMDKLPNVFWLRQQPSSCIPSFLKQMDILLVLYKPDEKGFKVNAHKTLEYLSSGKLVITPRHEENRPIEHLIVQAGSISEVPQVFDTVLNNYEEYVSPALRRARIDYASEMSYENRVRSIETICKETMKEDV